MSNSTSPDQAAQGKLYPITDKIRACAAVMSVSLIFGLLLLSYVTETRNNDRAVFKPMFERAIADSHDPAMAYYVDTWPSRFVIEQSAVSQTIATIIATIIAVVSYILMLHFILQRREMEERMG